jgi:hypothetical protein
MKKNTILTMMLFAVILLSSCEPESDGPCDETFYTVDGPQVIEFPCATTD